MPSSKDPSRLQSQAAKEKTYIYFTMFVSNMYKFILLLTAICNLYLSFIYKTSTDNFVLNYIKLYVKIIYKEIHRLKTYVDKLLDQRYPLSRRDNRMACIVRNFALAYCAGNRRRLRRTLCPISRRPFHRSDKN